MTAQHSFVLAPFPDGASCPTLALGGLAERKGNLLHLSYVLEGDLTNLHIPDREPRRDRRDNLWQTTCFECFLTGEDKSTYWEFNLSPSGCWNVYRFTGYRTGMQAEREFASLPFKLEQTGDRVQLDIDIDLRMLLSTNIQVRVAIATVIQTTSGELSYWALHHPRDRADFHDSRGFVLKM